MLYKIHDIVMTTISQMLCNITEGISYKFILKILYGTYNLCNVREGSCRNLTVSTPENQQYICYRSCQTQLCQYM